MSVKIFCDMPRCDLEITGNASEARFSVSDGKHSHNVSAVYRDVDVCLVCRLRLAKEAVEKQFAAEEQD